MSLIGASGAFVLNSPVSFCSLTLAKEQTEDWITCAFRRSQGSVVPKLPGSPDSSSEAGHPDACECACGIHLSGPRSPLLAAVKGEMLGLALGHAFGEGVNDCRKPEQTGFLCEHRAACGLLCSQCLQAMQPKWEQVSGHMHRPALEAAEATE